MSNVWRLVRGGALSAILATALAAFTNGALAQDLPSTRLKVVGSWDFLAQYKDFELPFWQKTVPQATGGAVTADVTAFNTMGLKGTEIVRLMKLGMIDFGTSVLAYGAEADVETEGIDLAGLSDTVDLARAVTSAYLPVLDEFFQKKHGIKVLAIWPYPAQIIYCKAPIDGLADLNGRKIRVGTRPIAEFVEAMGGVAVNIPFGDAYAALKEGKLDCGITGTLPGNAAKWYEVTRHLYTLPLGWSMSMQAVTLTAWQGLDPRVRTVLTAEMAKLSQSIWDRAGFETDEGINCNTGRGHCSLGTPSNMSLVPISDADRDLLAQVLRKVVVKRWAQRCSADCVEKWNATVGQVVNIHAEP